MSILSFSRFVIVTLAFVFALNPLEVQSAERTDTDSDILERLQAINRSLHDRIVDPGTPEGIFLDSLPNKKPLSHDVLNQLTLMVDIKKKVRSTTEPQSITSHAPCVTALISARAESIEPINNSLKRTDLPPKIRPILEELKMLMPKILAADEWRKTRRAQRSRPNTQSTPSSTGITAPPNVRPSKSEEAEGEASP